MILPILIHLQLMLILKNKIKIKKPLSFLCRYFLFCIINLDIEVKNVTVLSI